MYSCCLSGPQAFRLLKGTFPTKAGTTFGACLHLTWHCGPGLGLLTLLYHKAKSKILPPPLPQSGLREPVDI